jgi:hypothetical protein
VSFADTPKIQHYNTPPPFDAEDNFGTNVTVESVHECLNARVTTPRKKAVVPAEGPSQTQDIDDEEQCLFVDLIKNLIYLSGEKVCGKPGQAVRSRRP